ncbi:Long-chain fatty acid transport protein [gamma proteobacterium HdN1]|nr:Long-chain fatty acid transport protein [gamma proteobacterium HdN1]
MKKTPLAISLTLGTSIFIPNVFANGLAINEQSVSGAGTNYAGRASTPRDASTLYSNPAGLVRLEGSQITGGTGFIQAKTKIREVASSTAGTNRGDMVPNTFVPFGYFSQKINSRWAAGIGVYAPFGIKGEYEKGYAGRAYGLHNEVSVVSVQPTTSFQINPQFSLGAGITFNRIEGVLTNSIPNQYLNVPLNGETSLDIKGDDTSFGYNLGALVSIVDGLDWGIAYHSKLKFGLEGRTRVKTNIPGAAGRYKGTLDITMPESIDTSFSYRWKQWGAYTGATWMRWSRLSGIEVNNQNAGPFSRISESLNWKDTYSYAVGVSYDLEPTLQLRAGLGSDPSPTNDADRSVRIPVGDRYSFTLGAGWKVSSQLTVDVAYARIQEKWAEVNKYQYGSYLANFKNSANTLGVQLTYLF